MRQGKLYFLVLWLFSLGGLGMVKGETKVITLPDGLHLRLGHWKAEGKSSQSVSIILLQGRSSYIEKFQETIDDLRKRGYEVWTFDWRGSGGSTRLISSNPQKVYIDSYQTYINDLDYVIQHHVKKESSKPFILLGLSTGGHLALRYIEEKPQEAAGAFLVSPMLNIVTAPYPYCFARLMTATASWIGAGEAYVFGYGNYRKGLPLEPEKLGTTDPKRIQHLRALNLSHMNFVTAGPTFRWVYETIKSIELVNAPASLKKVSIPVMIIKAEKDTDVDTAKDEAICKKIPHCRLEIYKDANHNIYIAKDNIREQLFKDLGHFTSRLFRSSSKVS